MAKSTAARQAYFTGFRKQKSESIQEWLTRWVFTNDGAALIVDRGISSTAPLSLEQKHGTFILMTKGKWQTTIH